MLKKSIPVCLFSCLINFSLQATDWLIVAHAPSFSEKRLLNMSKNRMLVALDGVADDLKKYKIYPHVILGDFDSIKNKEFWGIKETFHEIDNSSAPYKGNFDVLIVPAKDQDHTDLEKAILFCDKQKASSIIILNATGGRMDHTLGNIGVLRKYHKKERPLAIYTRTEKIEYLKDGSTTIHGKPGDNVAIMGYPEAFMTTEGLAYNGKNFQLKLGLQESTCNSLAQNKATIDIQGEALVISKYAK